MPADPNDPHEAAFAAMLLPLVITSIIAGVARYQAALDAGADPKAVAEWTRQVQTECASVLARAATRDHHKPARQLTEHDIRTLITGLGDLRDVIHDAEPPVGGHGGSQVAGHIRRISGTISWPAVTVGDMSRTWP